MERAWSMDGRREEGLLDWQGAEESPEGVGPGSCSTQRLCLKTWEILLLLIVSHTYWLQLQPLLENKKKWRHWKQVLGYFVECEAYFITVILVLQDVMVPLVLWSVGCVDEGIIALHQKSPLLDWKLRNVLPLKNPFMVLLMIYVQIKKNRFFTHN